MNEPLDITLPDPDALHFERPPVVEVALGIQFEPVEGFTGLQAGLYWSRHRQRFPRTEEHPPLQTMFELFPAPRIPETKLELKVLDRPPVPRYWFVNERGSELIQIQQDRFIHNWRKMDDEDNYPRYQSVRATFVNEVNEFAEFLREQSLGGLTVNQCELTYVDHVLSGEHWSAHGDLAAVYRWWSNAPDADVGVPEEIRVHQRHLVRGPDGTPWGRLYSSIEPAWRVTDNRAMFVFRQLARGMGDGTSLSDALTFLDLAHKQIVQTFGGSMTPRMLEAWGMTTHG